MYKLVPNLPYIRKQMYSLKSMHCSPQMSSVIWLSQMKPIKSSKTWPSGHAINIAHRRKLRQYVHLKTVATTRCRDIKNGMLNYTFCSVYLSTTIWERRFLELRSIKKGFSYRFLTVKSIFIYDKLVLSTIRCICDPSGKPEIYSSKHNGLNFQQIGQCVQFLRISWTLYEISYQMMRSVLWMFESFSLLSYLNRNMKYSRLIWEYRIKYGCS